MVLNFLTDYYHDQLLNNKRASRARSYLKSRGINKHIINHFKLGFCHKGYDEVTKFGFPESEIDKSNMFRKTDEGRPYDFMFNRITIPIRTMGQTYSFTSRSIGHSEIPHLHRPGNIPISFNHDVLLNPNTTYVIITEAPIDTMTLEINGFNSIAVMGAGRMNRRIMEDLHDKETYILFDNDNNKSGSRGAKRLAQKLCDYDMRSSIVSFKDNNDVNSFFCNGGKRGEIEDMLENSYTHTGSKRDKKSFDENSGDIVETISQYIDIEAVGSRYRAVCPFHEESKPSLTIYPATNSFYCFGCGAAGGVQQFLKRIGN